MSFVLNHLWQSTVFGVLAAALAFFLRGARARTRYWIWLAASLKFLVPFSVVVLAASQIHLRPTHIPVGHAWRTAMVQASQPFQAVPFVETGSIPLAAASPDLLPRVLLLIWACGFVVVLGVWLRRWLSIRAIVRNASPCNIPIQLRALTSTALLEPAVFGIFRPVLLVPQGLLNRLSPKELRAIYTHELCHVRYRDNLAAAAHMLVEAMFWFHPLVWWLEKKLIEERERACDEEVLRSGNSPQEYAEGILAVCKFCLPSPMTCAAGVSGADLKQRIETIMCERLGQKLNTPKKLLLAAAGLMAIVVPIAIGGQQETFDVASIKPSNPSEQNSSVGSDHGEFKAENITTKTLIENAFDVHGFQIEGGPKWLDSSHYDIDAKTVEAEHEVRASASERQNRLAQARDNERLQALLADRFQLKTHRVTKELPVYALTTSKQGPKLQRSKDPSGRSGYGMGMGPGTLNGKELTMQALAANLSNVLSMVVIDKTGLTGRYDLALTWTPDEEQGNHLNSSGATPAPGDQGPSLFTAVEDQLGLKLVREKGPVEMLVIDHIEKPSPN